MLWMLGRSSCRVVGLLRNCGCAAGLDGLDRLLRVLVGSKKRWILYHKAGFLGLFWLSSLHRAGRRSLMDGVMFVDYIRQI